MTDSIIPMIVYESTRTTGATYTFSQAILQPLSIDGGLLVPTQIPRFQLSKLKRLLQKTYQQRAEFVFDLFETDLTPDSLRNSIHMAYGSQFHHPKIAPITKLKKNQYILELWYGPTAAFKDMALQIVPLLFAEGARLHNSLHYLILVVTTGDTGKAALEGFKNKKGFTIIVFYPKDNVSQLQELQMITQEGNNVAVYASLGDVDTTDTLVKELYKDPVFVQTLLTQHATALSSANSTNWARLIPQITYYIHSYLELVDTKIIQLGDPIDVVVPTGSFGNILSAYYAKKMGLPIRTIICASNDNHLVTDFLHTGIYDTTQHSLIATPSNSMDTLLAYNVERLLYILSHNNTKQVKEWMDQLTKTGKFEVTKEIKKIFDSEFFADWVTTKDCLKNIKQIYNDTGYLMDPHTSVAQAVVERYLSQQKKQIPLLIVSTAHWAKFPKSTYAALTSKPQDTINEFELIKKINKYVPNSYIPTNLTELEHKKIKHTGTNKPTKKDIQRIVLSHLDKFM